MTTVVPAWTGDVVAEQPYPMVFATVSGAHLYGFASVDSDVDLRGAHLLPPRELVGLRHGPETLSHTGDRAGVELDLVTHDLAKSCRLLLRRSGDVLEQVTSPLVIHTSETHAELLSLVPGCVSTGYADHYLGFATSSQLLFTKTNKLKPALYLLRVLCTGLHLMRTGTVQADLTLLYGDCDLPYVPDLIAAKREGEHRVLGTDAGLPGPDRILADTARLREQLNQAKADAKLPAQPTAADALHDLVVRARLGL
ncbi:nucleotidyltransferase domain-containing protein [Catellatospora sp. KI3]|uniref:nucleotidyltransferase domain-containing protein n=1 Tax=Catellatospora sp. KI3 TaxID=3041620 RepID=UPI0024832796|nr:nucleotidyltransferase domain-containing protein [Catellatospora sp. KI3]MDI1465701.1 nucleotidyltransferase domain-containing protein [Catellatospora sp. KI3]